MTPKEQQCSKLSLQTNYILEITYQHLKFSLPMASSETVGSDARKRDFKCSWHQPDVLAPRRNISANPGEVNGCGTLWWHRDVGEGTVTIQLSA